VLIMADDMGYECLSANGSISYNTPNIDRLAEKGIRFTQCYSQPLCTPSRVKIMTGQYNYRNYDTFGYLNPKDKTFGNVMKSAGYKTCIAGKWQLNGIYKDRMRPGGENTNRPYLFGFDEYCLWQLTKSGKQPNGRENSRYANPLIEQNGKVLSGLENQYGPDVFSDFICDFINSNREDKFFVYYPMVLPHGPFVPTPDCKDWSLPVNRSRRDTAYFKNMVSYVDKMVGKIYNHLEEQGLEDNTLFIFTTDNGTHRSIVSKTDKGTVNGGKGTMLDRGTHVPLVMIWPNMTKQCGVTDNLVEFSDFFATFADIVDDASKNDGHSLLPYLQGEKYSARNQILIHYDPDWSENVNQYRNRFSRNQEFKLYQDGRFYNIPSDPEERAPVGEHEMGRKAKRTKRLLQAELDKAPDWK